MMLEDYLGYQEELQLIQEHDRKLQRKALSQLAESAKTSVEQFKIALSKQPRLDLNAHFNNMTLLAHVAKFGIPAAVTYLLSLGDRISVDTLTGEGLTPLMYAAKVGNSQVVQILLNAGASPSTRSREGLAPCEIAAINGQEKVLEMLWIGPEDEVGPPSPDLLRVVESRMAKMTKDTLRLLESLYDFTDQTLGEMYLSACWSSNLEIVEYFHTDKCPDPLLIWQGFSRARADDSVYSYLLPVLPPLELDWNLVLKQSLESGLPFVVYILRHKAEYVDPDSLMSEFFNSRSVSQLSNLLRAAPDMASDFLVDGACPLLHSALLTWQASGEYDFYQGLILEEFVQVLLECRADPNLLNSNRNTALALALGNNLTRVKLVEALLRGGANPNTSIGLQLLQPDLSDWTPLGFTLRSASLQPLSGALITGGADVNHLQPNGQRPLEIAAAASNLEGMFQLLESPSWTGSLNFAHITSPDPGCTRVLSWLTTLSTCPVKSYRASVLFDSDIIHEAILNSFLRAHHLGGVDSDHGTEAQRSERRALIDEDRQSAWKSFPDKAAAELYRNEASPYSPGCYRMIPRHLWIPWYYIADVNVLLKLRLVCKTWNDALLDWIRKGSESLWRVLASEFPDDGENEVLDGASLVAYLGLTDLGQDNDDPADRNSEKNTAKYDLPLLTLCSDHGTAFTNSSRKNHSVLQFNDTVYVISRDDHSLGYYEDYEDFEDFL